MLVPKCILYILSTNVGLLSLHRLILPSLRINQIYIKRDKVKVQPYLHNNHSIGSISLFVDCFHLQNQLNSSQCQILYLYSFCISNNGIKKSVFHVFMKTQLSVFTNTPWVKLHRTIELLCKMKMPKRTTGCRIKSFIPVENTNVEKVRDI